MLSSYLRALLPNRTYFTNHSIPHIIDFFAMFPISHQIQVICELDGFRQLLQDINAESFAALLYVSSLISCVAVNGEDRHKHFYWKNSRTTTARFSILWNILSCLWVTMFFWINGEIIHRTLYMFVTLTNHNAVAWWEINRR